MVDAQELIDNEGTNAFKECRPGHGFPGKSADAIDQFLVDNRVALAGESGLLANLAPPCRSFAIPLSRSEG